MKFDDRTRREAPIEPEDHMRREGSLQWVTRHDADLKSERQKKTKGVTAKLISDLEKVVEERS